jgi:hypothetical protein
MWLVWPQIVYALFMLVGFMNMVRRDLTTLDLYITVAIYIFITWVLYCGGFWAPLAKVL